MVVYLTASVPTYPKILTCGAYRSIVPSQPRVSIRSAPRGVFYEKTLPLPYVSLFPLDYGFRLGILFELSRDTAGSGY